MRVVEVRERTLPISRYADPAVPSGGLNTSAVAVITDVIRGDVRSSAMASLRLVVLRKEGSFASASPDVCSPPARLTSSTTQGPTSTRFAHGV